MAFRQGSVAFGQGYVAFRQGSVAGHLLMPRRSAHYAKQLGRAYIYIFFCIVQCLLSDLRPFD